MKLVKNLNSEQQALLIIIFSCLVGTSITTNTNISVAISVILSIFLFYKNF
jgi:hypothetical protein